MNIKNIILVRELLDKGYAIFDALEDAIGKVDGMDTSLREMFKIDALKVVLYISATDGKLTSDEVDFLNGVFDLNKTPTDYIAVINECDIYSTRFENAGLFTLDVLSKVDKKIGTNSAENIVTILEAAAMATAVSDDDVTVQEGVKLKAYIATLKNKYC